MDAWIRRNYRSVALVAAISLLVLGLLRGDLALALLAFSAFALLIALVGDRLTALTLRWTEVSAKLMPEVAEAVAERREPRILYRTAGDTLHLSDEATAQVISGTGNVRLPAPRAEGKGTVVYPSTATATGAANQADVEAESARTRALRADTPEALADALVEYVQIKLGLEDRPDPHEPAP